MEVVVDILQVLEGATYTAFIVGALVAVIELRTMARDRKLELMMRSNELFCTREFEEATVNAVKGHFEPGKVSDVDMKMLCDHWDHMGTLVRLKLVDYKTATSLLNFDAVWQWSEPWIRTWEERVGKGRFDDFEWMANQQRTREPTTDGDRFRTKLVNR